MILLKSGHQGPKVTLLQERLINAGFLGEAGKTGIFDHTTARAVMDFQSAHNLVIDCIAGPKTWAALTERDTSHLLSEADLINAAERLGVELALIKAVRAVESKLRGFGKNGRPKILFERHIFRRRLLVHGISGGIINRHGSKYPGILNREPGGYIGGDAEWDRLAQAINIHETAALESCSWGMFQIMGYHAKGLGYDSVQAFATAMEESEGQQLDAFVRFIEADPSLKQALQRQEWAAFAKGYNGPNYRKNNYDQRLLHAYQAAVKEAA